MESLKILEISIVKRIFVVPLYLEHESAFRKHFYMVDFVSDGLSFFPIDYFLDLETVFLPTVIIGKCFSEPLCQLALTTTPINEFLCWDGDAMQYCFKLVYSSTHIMLKDCFRMMKGKNLEALLFDFFEHR